MLRSRFGDEFDDMNKTANDIASVLRQIKRIGGRQGRTTTGLPMLDIKLDKMAIARYGLNISEILDLISAAVGGREAGLVFEGDRRFPIVVRLPENIRQDLIALEKSSRPCDA